MISEKKAAGLSPAKRLSLGPTQLQAAADLFGLLSEESRLRILQCLQPGPLNVGELVRRSGLKQANVSRQLGLMLSAGVIDRRQVGNHAIYSIAMPLVYDLCELVCRGIARHAVQRATDLSPKGLSPKRAARA